MKLRTKIAEDRQRKISTMSIKERSVHEHDSAKVLGGIVLLFMVTNFQETDFIIELLVVVVVSNFDVQFDLKFYF